MMRTSAPTACSVFTVSTSDSPFETLLPEAETLMTSAPSILPASSNDVRVRVLFS